MIATDGNNQISGRQNETVMKMLIDYIKVNNKHEIEFKFKCGLTAKEIL